VRWHGENGDVIEAQHGSESTYDLPQEEREAWAQIALGSTSTQPDAFGPNAPWLRVTLDRSRAFELGMRAQRARMAHPSSYALNNSAPHLSGAPNQHHSSAPYGAQPTAQIQHGPMNPMNPGGRYTPDTRAEDYPTTQLIDALPSAPSRPESGQNTGQWSRADLLRGSGYAAAPMQQEVTVIPCVEVEMPILMTGDQQDFTRDFARDVADHFSRAARAIPQARELRGWMHGARIVLAVRMSFGPGTRAPNRAEMEHGAALLSEALAQRTLPYAQLRFAELPEWNQGVELPKS
jgi:hypothetical protein